MNMTVLDIDKVVAVTWNKKLKRVEFLVKERQVEKYSWVFHQSLPEHMIPLYFRQIAFHLNQFFDNQNYEDPTPGQEEEEEEHEQMDSDLYADSDYDDDDEVQNIQQVEVKIEETVSIQPGDINNNNIM